MTHVLTHMSGRGDRKAVMFISRQLNDEVRITLNVDIPQAAWGNTIADPCLSRKKAVYLGVSIIKAALFGIAE